MKVTIGKLDLIKGNLYTDSHKQTVYVDRKKKLGYIVPKKLNGLFRVMCENTLISFLLGILVWGEWGVYPGIIVLVVTWIVLFIAVRLMLKSFDCGEVNDLPVDRSIEESLKDDSKVALLLKGIVTLGLAIALIVYSIFFANFDLNTADGVVSIVAVIATSLYSFYICFNFIKIGIKRK